MKTLNQITVTLNKVNNTIEHRIINSRRLLPETIVEQLNMLHTIKNHLESKLDNMLTIK